MELRQEEREGRKVRSSLGIFRLVWIEHSHKEPTTLNILPQFFLFSSFDPKQYSQIKTYCLQGSSQNTCLDLYLSCTYCFICSAIVLFSVASFLKLTLLLDNPQTIVESSAGLFQLNVNVLGKCLKLHAFPCPTVRDSELGKTKTNTLCQSFKEAPDRMKGQALLLSYVDPDQEHRYHLQHRQHFQDSHFTREEKTRIKLKTSENYPFMSFFFQL